LESLASNAEPTAARGVFTASQPSARDVLSDWFVQHYRLSFVLIARDREYWPEVEAVIREKFVNGGTAGIWRTACLAFRDKPASIFSLLDRYNELLAEEKRTAQNRIEQSVDGEEKIGPEIREMLDELKERLAMRSDGAKGATPQLMAALALRTLADAREKGIEKDRIIFHTLDADAIGTGG